MHAQRARNTRAVHCARAAHEKPVVRKKKKTKIRIWATARQLRGLVGRRVDGRWVAAG